MEQQLLLPEKICGLKFEQYSKHSYVYRFDEMQCIDLRPVFFYLDKYETRSWTCTIRIYLVRQHIVDTDNIKFIDSYAHSLRDDALFDAYEQLEKDFIHLISNETRSQLQTIKDLYIIRDILQ